MITVGSTVSGYRADRLVGKGATATVFAATRLSDTRPVALKLLFPALQANPTVRARFHDAALLQRSLEHPNVAEVYEVGESDGESFLTMRLANDGTLAALLDEGLAARRALELLGQVADALDFAHLNGVSHGDVKPRNILIDDGVALLADFGLAVALRQATPAAAAAPGTLHYSAPERLRGDPPSSSADVYGLACVLFECLTGVVPYPHDTSAAAVGAHLFNAPPRASDIRFDFRPQSTLCSRAAWPRTPGTAQVRHGSSYRRLKRCSRAAAPCSVHPRARSRPRQSWARSRTRWPSHSPLSPILRRSTRIHRTRSRGRCSRAPW